MVGQQIVTIVVAEDFDEFRQFVCAMLLSKGLQVVAEAKDGLEAVAKSAEFQPDLVLLDISLPKLNGIEAATQIRSISPKSKVLFVSQNSDSDIVAAALQDGAMGYVWKSAINRDLLPAIAAALSGNRFVSADLHHSA